MFTGLFNRETKEQKPILSEELIKLQVTSVDKKTAIEMGGQMLADEGYVELSYIEAMKKREKQTSTFMGNGVAIPHGTNEAKQQIHYSGLSVLQIPEGIDYGEGNTAYLVVSIAGKEDEHLDILQNLASICQDEQEVKALINADNKEVIYNRLTGRGDK